MTNVDTAAPRAGRKQTRTSTTEPPKLRNDEFDWNAFDPRAYRRHNYVTMRDDDRQIVGILRDYFGQIQLAPDARGLDVGPGANLYPSLAMLPFCAKVDLIEHSASNFRWLKSQQRWYRRFLDFSWQPFWKLFGEHPNYRRHVHGHNALTQFRRKAEVHQGSIFTLGRRRWDIGTMFFVACSLSADRQEFYRAVTCFLTALKPGAPFAAAFMTGSKGYEINGRHFPAVPIDDDMIKRSLHALATHCDIVTIATDLRTDVGMVLVTGRRAQAGAAASRSQPKGRIKA